MKNFLKKLFTRKRNHDLSQYKGFSDFFLRAPENIKMDVIAEAAQRANEDQMKVYKQAQKIGA